MGGDDNGKGWCNSEISGHSASSSASLSKLCKCGLAAVLRTSRTPTNPGRMFFGCRNYKTREACNFFEWLDDGTCVNCNKKDKAFESLLVQLKVLHGVVILLVIVVGIMSYKM